jgi:hypothetical protein
MKVDRQTTGTRTRPAVRPAPATRSNGMVSSSQKVGGNRPGPVLPIGHSVASHDANDITILMHGERKIGKTTFFAQFPDTAFLLFEPGAKFLSIQKTQVPDWATFLRAVKELENTDRFRTVVIDTVSLAYTRCFEHVCREAGVDHPSEGKDFGQVWDAIEKTFTRTMDRILHTGRGVAFIAHSEVRDFQHTDGSVRSKIIPDLTKQARKYAAGLADIIAYYGYYGEERLLTIRGSSDVDAGCRLDEHFLNSHGEPVRSIPMGHSPQDAYANYIASFGNLLDDAHPDDTTTSFSEVPAKREARKPGGRR